MPERRFSRFAPPRKVVVALAAFAAGLLVHASSAFAQAYPAKPIRMIVPVPPGGATDTMTRQLSDLLAARLGQTIVVENRAGAGGTVGAGFVAKQGPDGYTLLMAFSGAIAIAGSLYKSLPYDPLKDLEPVSMVVMSPLVLVTREGFPARDLQGYVERARQKANGVSYGSPGKGSSIHLAGEIFARATGTQLLHVPYKGSGPAMQDLYGGRLDSIFADVMQLMSAIQSGKVNAIAVTSRERNPLLPKLPTVAESGYPDFEVVAWHGIFVPAGTPAEIVGRLHHEISATLKAPAVVKFLTERGGVILDLPPAEAKEYVHKEARKWARIVKEVGFTHD